MGKSLRLAVATALVAVPAATGLGMAPGFAAEEVPEVRQTVGGCWTYVPEKDTEQPPTPLNQRAVEADVSQEILPWSPAGPDGQLLGTLLDLRSTGAHSVGGERAVELAVSDGPVLDRDADVTGTATAHLVILPLEDTAGEPESRLVTVPFEALAGQSVQPMVFQDSFAIREGSFRVQLESLFFQNTATPDEVTICNSQVLAEATVGDGAEPGVNPATEPLATGATVEFEALAGVSLGIQAVLGQQATVTTAARVGDVLDVRVAGLATESPFRLQITGAATVPLADVEGVTEFAVDEAGRAELAVPVPAEAPTQAGQVQLVQEIEGVATIVNEIPLTVLDVPRVAAVEKVGEADVEVSLGGSDWDPLASVTVVPMAGDVPSADEAVEFAAGADGVFSESLILTDEATDGLAVTQERSDEFETLAVTYALVNSVPVAPVEPSPSPTPSPEPSEPATPTTPPTAAPAPPTVVNPPVAPPVAPPVEVPLPDELPIGDVDAPPAVEATEEILMVSEATLAGETSLGELFGGPSRRDVRILVENAGTALVSNPFVRLGVGRDGDVQPALVAAEVGDLQPGARVMVSVDVALPMASLGTYQVVGQVGEDTATRFQLRWDTYPWGLIVLNLAGIALLVWGVARRRRAIAPTPLAGAAADEESASVVDLHALDEWWVRGRVARVAAPISDADDDSDSVVDLEAAENWWAKRGSKVS